MMNDKLVITIICIWVLVCTVQGSDIDCTVDCACCVERKCGPGNYFSDECTLGCIDGYAGARCYSKCPGNCKRCSSVNGLLPCTVCHEGYYDLADDCIECMPTCKTCTSGSSCTSCKDEYYNDNGSSDCRYRKCPENCKCENDQCTSCMQGYYGTSKSCISSCPGNCFTCSSATLCDSCKEGHYNGYQYDDSTFSLKTDCSYNCRDNCVICSSYELCLVCKSGLYGPGCEKKCSVGCTSGTCDKETGLCSCAPYFAGEKCDICQQGKYGDRCDMNCSLVCKDNLCERQSGKCTNGCIVETIVGNICDICQADLHGTFCNLSCTVGARSSEQPVNTAVVLLGALLAVSLVGNIIVAAISIYRKYWQRKSQKGQMYENTENELQSESVTNVNDSPHTAYVNSNVKASKSAESRDYEDLSGIQATEDEYGPIGTTA